MKTVLLSSLLLFTIHFFVDAATVPGVFNTGVDAAGILIDTSGAVDPHYQLIESPDDMSPGPESVTLNPGFPVGPWLAEGPNSRWIAPRAEQNIGSAEGDYTYRTEFSLDGFDPATAVLNGRWATDNSGVDIILNGESQFITSGGFGDFTEFQITSGFVEGINTLDFVLNNAPATNNPTGLRVELDVTADLLDVAPPSIVVQPVNQLGLVGDTVSLGVKVTGSPPLTFEWKRGGEVVATITEETYIISNIQSDQAGEYLVTVSNPVGSVDSKVAVISVKEPIPGLFNTGVDDNGVVLDDLAPDRHYQLTINPDSDATEPVVHDSQIFPIVEGPYIANSETSKWIAPLGDTSAAASGDYHYTITFDLTGLDPKTAFLSGLWASDNAGVDTILNGASLGIGNQGGFANLSRFTIENAPFVSGENTLTFVINNAGAGYTAFRIEGMRGGANVSTAAGNQAPTVLLQPIGAQALAGETVTLKSLADGSGPLAYEWRRNDEIVGNGPELVLENIQPAQEGSYQVTISNAQGTITSESAMVEVLEPIPGLYNTGVDDAGNALDDLLVDGHYTIVLDPEEAAPDALVLDSTLFPIVAGPWLANTPRAKWIGVQEDNNGPGGDYGYQLTFDLSAFDPTAIFIEGEWATDNLGLDILLNGESTGTRSDGQFSAATKFRFEEGFVSGLNTLEFQFNNAGDAANPTGLLVRGLRGGGKTEDPNLIVPNATPFGQRDSTNIVDVMIPLRNSGRTQVLAISDAKISGPAAASFTLADVPSALQPNETVMVALSFDPQGATGNFSAMLEIASNDPSSPILIADISAFIPVAPGLVAHYQLDETAGETVIDASGFGRSGRLVATAGSLTVGQDPLATGRSLQLIEGAYIELGPNVLPAFGPNFSISLWVNAGASNGAASLISRGDGAGDPFALVANGTALLWFSGGDQALLVEDALTLNETHHVLVVADGNQVTLYVDGVSVGSADTVAYMDDAKQTLQLGAANGILGFNGRIDDVQVYDRSLNAEQAAFLVANPGQVIGANQGVPPGGGTSVDFVITDIQTGAGGNVRVNFTSVPDKTYVAEFSTDLVTWEVTVDDIASEGEMTIVRQVKPAAPTGFIRIREKL